MVGYIFLIIVLKRIDVATFRCYQRDYRQKTYSRKEVALKGQNATLDGATSNRILRYATLLLVFIETVRAQMTDNSGEVILGKLTVYSNYMIVEIKSGAISYSVRILTESAFIFGGERVDHFCVQIN